MTGVLDHRATGEPPPGEALRRTAERVRVLVVGSVNQDLILHADEEPDDDGSILARSMVTAPGGHAGNCAAALAALGIRSALVAAVGLDPEGDQLIADLDERGVDTNFVHRFVDHPTGRVVIPVFGERHYMLMYRGANDLLSGAKVRDALSGPADAVMLFDPSEEALLEVAAVVSAKRPRPLLVWIPGGLYSGNPISAQILPHCDVILLNRDEYRRMSALNLCLEDQECLEVVVTLGAEGALLKRRGDEWRVSAAPATVVDPTGAGDAFAAAYLLSLLAGLDPETRLWTGNMSGALAVSAIGARTRLATLTDLTMARALPETHVMSRTQTLRKRVASMDVAPEEFA